MDLIPSFFLSPLVISTIDVCYRRLKKILIAIVANLFKVCDDDDDNTPTTRGRTRQNEGFM